MISRYCVYLQVPIQTCSSKVGQMCFQNQPLVIEQVYRLPRIKFSFQNNNNTLNFGFDCSNFGFSYYQYSTYKGFELN